MNGDWRYITRLAGCGAALFGATGVLMATPAEMAEAAAGGTGVYELQDFVVNGQTYAFGGQKLVLVTDKELELIQPGDLNDIFAFDPSIQVGGGIAVAEKIYVRGIEDKLLNITIDGVPQAGYLSHHQGQYLIEPELLKRVETEPGPGGATQGAGALAGSIRFVTKGPEDFIDPNATYGGLLKTTYNENSEGNGFTGVFATRAGEQFAVMGAFTFNDAGDYYDGNGERVDYTGHKQWRAFLKGTGDFAGGQRLSLSVERVENTGWYRHRPNFYGWFDHPLAPNDPVDMTFRRDTVKLGYESSPGAEGGFIGSLFYTDSSVDRKGQYEMSYASVGGDFGKEFLFGDHTVVTGIDYRRDTLEFTGKGSVTGFARTLTYETIPDETVDILGLYAQDSWAATDVLQVSFGARFDYYDYTDKDAQTYEDVGFSPNIGVAYQVFEPLSLNASYGFAFRGVTVIDAITANEGTVVNAESIKGERARNMEVGFQYSAGPILFSGTVYRQKIQDVIAGTSPRQNDGSLDVEGYDLSVALTLGQFRASVAVSESDLEHKGEPITDNSLGLGIPYGRSWNGHLSYTEPRLNLTGGWTIHYMEAFGDLPDGLDPEIFRKPSYAVHGVYLQWAGLEDNRLVLTASIQNLFDKYYVNQATSGYNSQIGRIAGLPARGREFRLAASYSF